MRSHKTLVKIAATAMSALLLTLCACSFDNEERYTQDSYVLGERMQLEYTCNSNEAESIKAAVSATLMDSTTKLNEETPDSEINQIRQSTEGTAVYVDLKTMEFLLTVKDTATRFQKTEICANLDCYEFYPLELKVCRNNRPKEYAIDFHSFHFGYAIDCVRKTIEKQHFDIPNIMISCGNVVYANGNNRENAPYRIAIPDPIDHKGSNNILCFCEPKGDTLSIVTAEGPFSYPDQSYDTSKGTPILAAVRGQDGSVVQYSADEFYTMPLEEIKTKLCDFPELEVLIVFDDNTVYSTEGFRPVSTSTYYNWLPFA